MTLIVLIVEVAILKWGTKKTARSEDDPRSNATLPLPCEVQGSSEVLEYCCEVQQKKNPPRGVEKKSPEVGHHEVRCKSDRSQ